MTARDEGAADLRGPVGHAASKVTGVGRSLLVCSLAVGGACRNDGAAGDERDRAALSGEREEASSPAVGYDLRRLRPREQPLEAMFAEKAAAARGEGKRVVVLFSADWCAPCRHLDTELGNRHPPELIGDVRIFELKEEEWQAAMRMDEFNRLRGRWYPLLGSYPVMVVLDGQERAVEEMKQGRARLESEGLEPTLPLWLESTREREGSSALPVVPG